jgi:hypothetical protein
MPEVVRTAFAKCICTQQAWTVAKSAYIACSGSSAAMVPSFQSACSLSKVEFDATTGPKSGGLSMKREMREGGMVLFYLGVSLFVLFSNCI